MLTTPVLPLVLWPCLILPSTIIVISCIDVKIVLPSLIPVPFRDVVTNGRYVHKSLESLERCRHAHPILVTANCHCCIYLPSFLSQLPLCFLNLFHICHFPPSSNSVLIRASLQGLNKIKKRKADLLSYLS